MKLKKNPTKINIGRQKKNMMLLRRSMKRSMAKYKEKARNKNKQRKTQKNPSEKLFI